MKTLFIIIASVCVFAYLTKGQGSAGLNSANLGAAWVQVLGLADSIIRVVVATIRNYAQFVVLGVLFLIGFRVIVRR